MTRKKRPTTPQTPSNPECFWRSPTSVWAQGADSQYNLTVLLGPLSAPPTTTLAYVFLFWFGFFAWKLHSHHFIEFSLGRKALSSLHKAFLPPRQHTRLIFIHIPLYISFIVSFSHSTLLNQATPTPFITGGCPFFFLLFFLYFFSFAQKNCTYSKRTNEDYSSLCW